MPPKRVYKKKTTYKKKSYKKKPIVSKTVKAYVAKAIKKAPEIQNKDSVIALTQLFHNNFSSPVPLFATGILPNKDDGSEGIAGQKYRLLGFRIRMLCGQKPDRPNVTWRIVVFSMKSDVSQTYANVFTNATGNVLLDDLNDKYITKHKDFRFKPYTGRMENSTDEFTFPKQFNISYKRIINTDGSTSLPKNQDPLYYMVLVYDAYGTLVTDNIAYTYTWISSRFQDI